MRKGRWVVSRRNPKNPIAITKPMPTNRISEDRLPVSHPRPVRRSNRVAGYAALITSIVTISELLRLYRTIL